MAQKRYSEEHEWVEAVDGVGICGITDFAQEQLGDVVFVELPDVGRKVSKGEEIAVVESVKAASDIFAPISGEVIAINDALTDAPETVNSGAEGDGWMFKIQLSDAAELEDLMDAAAYQAFVEAQ